MKVKWDKNAIATITNEFVEGQKSLVQDEMNKRFQRQEGAEGKNFPRKTKGKYLYNTGQMIASLKVYVTQKYIKWLLQNKADIYKKYLEDKTQWLTLDDELLDKIMNQYKKNLKKKGF